MMKSFPGLGATAMRKYSNASRSGDARARHPLRRQPDTVSVGRDDGGYGRPESKITAHSTRVYASPRGTFETDRREDLSKALKALPTDESGQVNPDALVDEDGLMSLSQAVERLVLEGFGSGAEVAFEHAVAQLFADYADDLQLDDSEIAKAQQLMLKDAKDAISDLEVRPWDPYSPAPAAMNLDETIEALQEKIFERRQLLMEASGDLSRVLAELTVDAREGGDDEQSALGAFLKRFSDANNARSSQSLRQSARQQLLSEDPFRPSSPDSLLFGSEFLSQIEVAEG